MKTVPYDVEENSIVGAVPSQIPLLNTLEDGSIRVQHREFLGDLNTGVGVAQAIYRLNPSTATTFPWLSGFSDQFEMWEPKGIVFEFVSTCGNAVSSTNAALGSLSMATQYQTYAPGFVTKVQLLNHYFACSTKTADNLLHAVECKAGENPLTRYNIQPHGSDRKGTDLGYLTVMAQGSQSVYTAGELWISYDIILSKPRIDPGASPGPTIQELFELQEESKDEEEAASKGELATLPSYDGSGKLLHRLAGMPSPYVHIPTPGVRSLRGQPLRP
jgi:hypothetical protein